MTKVLFNISCLEQGGAERVVTNLSNKLAKDGYEIVVATQWQGKNEFKLDDKVRRIHVGLREGDEDCNRIRRVVRKIIYLRKAIQSEKPDVVISFLKHNNYRALISGVGIRIPHIIAVRNDPKSDYGEKIDKLLISLLFPLAQGKVFQTKEQKEYFSKVVQNGAEIILNPVHNKYIEAQPPVMKEKCVVQSGRLVGFKNQQMLVRAFVKVHEKYPDYQLKFYGRETDDGTKELLEQLICEKKAQDYIHLMGASDELEYLIPKAEIAAFSSDYEGLPNAVIEAMVLGMPVIATDCPCGGPGTLIQHEENGLLIPVGDEQAMADSICRLIEDKEFANKLGANARRLANRVNEEAIVQQWKDYIQRIIK